MNFEYQVNKINRGFVYLDGASPRPGFFVPAAAGVRTPAGGVLDPAFPSPGGGRAGGWGGPRDGHKKTAQLGPRYTTGGHCCPLGGVRIADPAPS